MSLMSSIAAKIANARAVSNRGSRPLPPPVRGFNPADFRGAAGVAGGMMPAVNPPKAPPIYRPPTAAFAPFRGAAGVTGSPQPFNPAPFRGAAGVTGVGGRPAPPPLNPANFRGAAGVTGVPGTPNTPFASEQYYIDYYTEQLEAQAGLERQLGLPPGSLSGDPTAGLGTASSPAGGGGGGGGTGSGGGTGTAAGGGMQSILDTIRGSYGGQRSAVDEQLAAAIAAQGGRRTAAGAARDEGTAQLGRILSELNAGAAAAGQRVGEAYSGGVSQIGQLMQNYEAMLNQRAAAGGRTLSAFGADASMAQPGGMAASDFLAAEAGALTGAGTTEGAYFASRPLAFQGMASDIGTQRALAYEQLMGQISNQEQQAQADASARRAQLSTEEELAILQAQQQQYQFDQEMAARGLRGGGGGGAASAGGGGSLGFLPLPSAFGGAG